MAHHSEEYGTIVSVHHPIVTVRGLPGAQVGEVVAFDKDTWGVIFSLLDEVVEVMVFATEPRQVGASVTRLGHPLTVALSPELIGQTVSPLCTVTKKNGVGVATDTPPPLLSQRQRITQPLTTGISLVDLLLPLGKGQRELIVGDRKTGKTTFALQVAEAQVKAGALVVYASIGKLNSESKRLQEDFKKRGIADSVTLVTATADQPATVIYQTPFVAMAIAEYFLTLGKEVLIIFDDLTTHAKYYREISLVAKRFPGRDSYPGDIFYTHARLLERAGCFANPVNPAECISISALPMAETTDAELTDYIVSNLISITDGHLLFSSSVFAQGQRPAIHPGLSVTRVGKQTQKTVEHNMGQLLTSFINLYEKTISLTHFGAELTDTTQAILTRGESFFAFLQQTRDTAFSEPVMLVMSTAILLDWFAGQPAAAVQQARDQLQTKYATTPAVQTKLDELAKKCDSVKALEAVLSKEKEYFTKLWQHSKK